MFARMMARGAKKYDAFIDQRKRKLLGSLRGTVVEVGAGAGANLPMLPTGIRWIGIEPNHHFEEHIRAKARDTGHEDIDVRIALGQDTGLPDDSADAVVITLVLCSVPDAPAVLAEVRRILKPGGRFVFIEHVIAEPKTMLRLIQRIVRRPWRWIGDGCDVCRDTEGVIRDAGFEGLELDRFRAPALWASPHIAGTATNPA